MTQTAADAYFGWLQEQVLVENGRRTSNTYTQLLALLWGKEFVWFVPNDDNRVADGLGVREAWLFENDVDSSDLEQYPCSVLEVIVALSQRLAFMVENTTAPGWAWGLIENLGLHRFKDPISPRREESVLVILENLVWRTYEPNGQGGLFPTAWSTEDQRKVELWYQMSTYVEEQQLP